MIDFIWHQCQHKNGFKRYTYQKLKDESSEFATSFPFMSTQEVVYWARAFHPNVSIHAYDSTYKKLMKHLATTPRHDISLVFFIKDNHCYPITDEGQIGVVLTICRYVSACCLSCLSLSLGMIIDVMTQTFPLPREGLTS